MKKYCFLILIASITLFTTSCSGKYDNVISDYILVADTLNAKTGIKINEVKELKKITVGDSITYINHKAEQGLRLQVENVEKQLASYQEDLVKANSGAAGKIIVEAYTNQIVRTKQTIDSLKTIKPEPTKLYD